MALPGLSLEKMLKAAGVDPAASIGKVTELIASADNRLATIQAYVETLHGVAASLDFLIQQSQAQGVQLAAVTSELAQLRQQIRDQVITSPLGPVETATQG